MASCFLYRRVCDNMLMIHDPRECRNWGTPDYQFYEFSDRNIRYVMGTDSIPLHLGNFVRDYIEKNTTADHMKTIGRGEYTETDRLIQDAIRAYAFLDSKERVTIHKKELNRLRSELRREQAWSVY